jgi:enoyl-[acyl-carrier-protein] reductase (NADH)
VANLALFLASDEARYITGVAIPIDGGMIAGKYIQNWEEFFASVTERKQE